MTSPTMHELRIDQWAGAGRHVLMLSGSLDLDSAAELESVLARLAVDGAQEIELDLRDLEFLDSAGLAALLACRDLCAEGGTACYVVSGRGAADKLLSLTGLQGVLPGRAPTFD
ncbi:MAG TPA: STAS domain-containing protein [Solirubrobacteraceae bacterium]|nr:STAS domain-containing protein [Solirubrobacteraceae bacterium]